MGLLTSGVLVAAVCCILGEAIVFDSNSFFLTNYYYKQSRLALPSSLDLVSYEGPYYEDQLWFLKPSGRGDGCYYLENDYRPQYRIANQNKEEVFAYNGNHYNDQLWKFEPGKGGAYYIVNCAYPQRRLANWQRKKIIAYNGNKYDDQLWILESRLTAEIVSTTVKHIDNLQGPTPIPIEVTITEGFKKSETNSATMTQRYRLAMEASIGVEISVVSASASISAEFENTIERFTSITTETYWEKTETITYTVPAHRNWKIMQHQVRLHSKIPSDRAVMYAFSKIFVSKTGTFTDNTGWIVNSS